MRVIKNNNCKPYIIYLRDEQLTETIYSDHPHVRITWEDGRLQGSTLKSVLQIGDKDAELLIKKG